MATAELSFAVPGLTATESNFAPIEKVSGTNIKKLVCAFDDTTQEYRNGTLQVPTDINTAGTVTFRAFVIAKTAAASKNVQLSFEHKALDNSEAHDAAYTAEDSGDKAVDATQGDLTEITWTETVSNLGWAANDFVYFRISRKDASANDLVGDLYWELFTIEIPLA
jgi:hypothetical protein